MSSLMNINNENGVIFVQGKERPMAEILPTNYNMFINLIYYKIGISNQEMVQGQLFKGLNVKRNVLTFQKKINEKLLSLCAMEEFLKSYISKVKALAIKEQNDILELRTSFHQRVHKKVKGCTVTGEKP